MKRSVYILNNENGSIVRVPGQFSDKEEDEMKSLKDLISDNLNRGMFLVFVAPYDSWWDRVEK